jgi:thiamine kinase-like enzyme
LYEEILPELLKFQEEYNIPNPFKSVTQLLGYISDEFKETLLLENLKEAGYSLCNRREPLDSQHLSLVIVEYGKLHALSHAMKKLMPEKYKEITKHIGSNVMVEFQQQRRKEESKDAPARPNPFNDDGIPMEADMFLTPTMEAVKNKPRLLEAMKRFKKNCFKLMLESNQKPDEHSVISHGDAWSTNLLFKYEDKDKPTVPTKLCIIDWQMSLVVTPIHDISYFLYISAGKNDLDNYMRYLHLYHTALSETLTAFGLDPEDVYPFELFEKEWNEKSQIGFFMTLVMMQQTLSEGKLHDFEKLAEEGKDLFDFSDRKLQLSDLFLQRMGDLVEFLVAHEFI